MSEQKRFLKAIGKNVDRLRKVEGLSFQELALRCDIEKSNLVKITSEGTNITMETLLKISKGLKVPPSKILDFPF